MTENFVGIKLALDASQFTDSLGKSSKALDNLGRTSKRSGERLADVAKAVGRGTEVARRSVDSYERQAASFKKAFETAESGAKSFLPALRDLGDAAGESEEAAANAGQAMKRVFSENETVMERFGRTTSQTLVGISDGFKATFQSTMPFSLQEALNAFESFQKSLSTGLEGVFFEFFSGTTSRDVRDRWKEFLEDMEKAFFASLARMASALVQENLLAPVFQVGASALGAGLEGLKGLLGLSEGGLVKKPTVALLGEAGPELVLPLDQIGSTLLSSILRRTLSGAAAEVGAAAGGAASIPAAAA